MRRAGKPRSVRVVVRARSRRPPSSADVERAADDDVESFVGASRSRDSGEVRVDAGRPEQRRRRNKGRCAEANSVQGCTELELSSAAHCGWIGSRVRDGLWPNTGIGYTEAARCSLGGRLGHSVSAFISGGVVLLCHTVMERCG